MTAKQRAIRERLRELEEANDGLLTPEDVVRDARNPDSVLHGEFEWDDSTAAHKYRLDQARALIRATRYIETTTQTETSAPNYLAVTLSAERRGYANADRIRASQELARQVFNDEIGRAEAALVRARAVSDVLGLREQMEQALAFVANIRQAAA